MKSRRTRGLYASIDKVATFEETVEEVFGEGERKEGRDFDGGRDGEDDEDEIPPAAGERRFCAFGTTHERVLILSTK